MRKRHKRKFKEHTISVEGIKRYKVDTGKLGNPRVTNLVEPTSYQMMGVEKGWTDVISSCPVFQQSLDKDHGTVTMASSGGGGAKLHTTTTKTYDYLTLRCNVCVGDRAGHHILDNFEQRGITILLSDQHSPALVNMGTGSCVVVMRYSNTTLSEHHEYMMLPMLKHHVEFQSKDRNGFTEVMQMALHEGLEITLAVCSGTSWLTDGPAGYAESLQVIYDWSQSYTFKMHQRGEKARSLITCVLFPQPMLPFIKMNEGENQVRQQLNQNSFEMTNLARIMIGASSHSSVRSGQSETDLVGMVELERSVNDVYFASVPYSFRSQIKSGGNPCHDKMSVKMRLSEKVNWLSQDRSDSEQRLTLKFLLNWCSALMTDFRAYGQGSNHTRQQLLAMRAMNPNILVDEQKWDEQVEAQRVTEGGAVAYCGHPTVHPETHCDTVPSMAVHKETCLKPGKN